MEDSTVTLPRLKSAHGSVTPPGSKSVANRVLPIAATGAGEIRLDNIPKGEDVHHMLESLDKLGIKMTRMNSCVHIKGNGGSFRNADPIKLHLGNSGTASRFLTGMLCAGHGEYQIDGIQRLRERPVGALVEGLRQLVRPQSSGRETTKIHYLQNAGFPPLYIQARGLQGGKTAIQGNVSSQFLSGLLMAFPFCKSAATLQVLGECVSAPYVQLTVGIMEKFGAPVAGNEKNFHIKSPRGYHNPQSFYVEADASSASYFLAAGAIAGGPVTVKGIGKQTMQASGEGRFAGVLEKMGAHVHMGKDSITVSRGKLTALDINMDEMTDTAMTLAVLSLFAEGTTRISGIRNWRHKETDRLRAMSTELRKLGAMVQEGEESLIISPPEEWRAAKISTYNDHRMAMSFSLAAFSKAEIILANPKCVSKTYPNYFDEFYRITN